MKKFKFPLILLALVFAIMGAFAFHPKPVTENKTSTTYYYVGDNTLVQMQNKNNWLNSGTSCGSSGDKPCTYITNLSRAGFDAHVAAFPSTNQAIAESATIKF